MSKESLLLERLPPPLSSGKGGSSVVMERVAFAVYDTKAACDKLSI